ncbi:MAG: hypothetical protein RIT32_235 [Actinomycetota bacterium]
MDPIIVEQIPKKSILRAEAARWSIKAWRDSFPNDTAQWYLNLYKRGDFANSIPFTVAALSGTKLIGIGSLVSDDELPDSTERGPWLAAVFVQPQYRRHGAGSAIVNALLDRAFELGYREVFAYTETKLAWYQKMNWEFIRTAQVANHDVSVIKRRLN